MLELFTCHTVTRPNTAAPTVLMLLLMTFTTACKVSYYYVSCILTIMFSVVTMAAVLHTCKVSKLKITVDTDCVIATTTTTGAGGAHEDGQALTRMKV